MDHENGINNPNDGAAAAGQESQNQPDQRQDVERSAEERLSASSAFLDTLVGDNPDGQGAAGQGDAQGAITGQPRDESGRFAPKAGQPVQLQPPADGQPAAGQPPAGDASKPPIDEAAKQAQEDAELLDGIKSERGRERVQKLISERNETRAQAEQVTQNLQQVQQVLQDAGMDAGQFAQHIEFSRLINSNDPQNLHVAAQMVEQVRADIYKRLGKDAPGVDVLADFPDLAQRVGNFELDRNAALEIAQYRRQQQQLQQSRHAEQQRQQDDQQFQLSLQRGIGDAQAYLQSRSGEVDHPARMEVLQKYFADPKNQQEFARTYRPEQMAHAVRWMYDNIQVAPRSAAPAPLRSRPQPIGREALGADASPTQRMSSILEQMGI